MKIYLGAKPNTGYLNPKLNIHETNSFTYKSKMNLLKNDVFQKIQFKGYTQTTPTKAVKTGENLYNPYPKMLHNIVIERLSTNGPTSRYRVSNAHVFDHEIDAITKKTTAQFTLQDLSRSNKIILSWESPKFELFSVGLYTAIEKSRETKSKLLIEITNHKSLLKFTQQGFNLSKAGYRYDEIDNAIKTNNLIALETIFKDEYINEGNAKIYVEISEDKALEVKEKILNHLRKKNENDSIEKLAQRGELLPIPEMGRYLIKDNNGLEIEEYNGFNSNCILTIGKYGDKTKIISYNKDKNQPTLLNGNILRTELTATLDKGDTISIQDKVYSITDKGLRLVSDDKKTFFKLFPQGLKGISFNQGRLGDCYFLAALHSLLQKPEGQELIAHMITKVSSDTYKVRFPGFPEHPLKVNISDINKLNGVKTDILGVKILEVAFGKLRKEFTWGNESLNKNNDVSLWLKGGWPDDALYVLTGHKKIFLDSENKTNNKGCNTSNTPFYYAVNSPELYLTRAESLLNKLSNTNKTYIITASSCNDSSAKSFLIDDTELCLLKKNHAFSITHIDKDKKLINLVDPGHTHIPLEITYDYFLQHFNTICAVELPFKC